MKFSILALLPAVLLAQTAFANPEAAPDAAPAPEAYPDALADYSELAKRTDDFEQTSQKAYLARREDAPPPLPDLTKSYGIDVSKSEWLLWRMLANGQR